MFRRVSVLVDDLAPERGAFTHSLDWATRLGVPVRGYPTGTTLLAVGQQAEGDSTRLSICASVCSRLRLGWEAAPEASSSFLAADAAPEGDLWVFGQNLEPPVREEMLFRAARRPLTPVLACAPGCGRLQRVLVLNDASSSDGFVGRAAAVCRAAGLAPVVLTVARTEPEALRRQQAAERLFSDRRAAAEFDSLIGGDSRSAVAVEAACRRCSLVLVARPERPAVWRWLYGDPLHRFLGLEGLSILTLSAAPPGGPPENCPAFPEAGAGRASTAMLADSTK